MGKQQRLPNGDLLITESLHGRAFEDGRHGPFVIKGRLRFDREAFVPIQDEASPLCAALLEDDREQRAQKVVEDDRSVDG